MPKLYELSEQYRKFNELVEDALDNMDDLTEDDLQLFVDTLESIEDAVSNKVENIAKFLKNIEGDIEALKNEEKRLNQKRKYLENKFSGLKEYTQQMLESAGIEKVKAGMFNVRLQNNPPSVHVLDESKIPQEYRIPQPDKILNKEILNALKEGKNIDGAVIAPVKKHIRFS